MNDTEATASAADDFRSRALGDLQSAAEELFANYGAELKLDTSAEELQRRLELTLGAAIGFTSPHVRGILAITVDDDLAHQMNPVANGNAGDASGDWIGELANQLLGRLKNKLLSCGVELALSTPVIVEGNHLRIGGVQRRATKLRFTDSTREADIWWDAEVDDDLVLVESAEEAQAEGDMLLF